LFKNIAFSEEIPKNAVKWENEEKFIGQNIAKIHLEIRNMVVQIHWYRYSNTFITADPILKTKKRI
jgi:hypothetical protein